MKVILDTNVLISAFVFKGFAKEVFEYCYMYHQLYTSPWLLDKFEEKLETKLKAPGSKIESATALIRRGFSIENPTGPLPDVCRDSDDNNVLLLAASINADYIITGDNDLLVLEAYEGTRIQSPREFWETVSK